MLYDEQKRLDNVLFDAAYNGNLNWIMKCIQNGIDVEGRYYSGWTALHMASQNGHLKIVQYLTKQCNANIETKNNNGQSALLYAVENDRLDIVQYLTKYCNANVESKNYDGHTALHIACHKGHLSIVLYLIQECNANVDAIDDEGWRNAVDLYLAAIDGNLNKLMECIRNGVDVETQTHFGWTALHFATYCGKIPIVQYLIDVYHVDITITTNKGETAFDVACLSKFRNDFVMYLLQEF
jgi:ankyrin repeat protein